MNLLDLHWQDEIFTGLIFDNEKYFIIYGYSQQPHIDIEKIFSDDVCLTLEGQIKSDIVVNKNTLFHVISLDNAEDYPLAERIIRIIFGE